MFPHREFVLHEIDRRCASGERLVAMRTKIREAAKKCTDLDTLTAAFEILANEADFTYAEETEREELAKAGLAKIKA